MSGQTRPLQAIGYWVALADDGTAEAAEVVYHEHEEDAARSYVSQGGRRVVVRVGPEVRVVLGHPLRLRGAS